MVAVESHPLQLKNVLNVDVDGFMANGLQAALIKLGRALGEVTRQLVDLDRPYEAGGWRHQLTSRQLLQEFRAHRWPGKGAKPRRRWGSVVTGATKRKLAQPLARSLRGV